MILELHTLPTKLGQGLGLRNTPESSRNDTEPANGEAIFPEFRWIWIAVYFLLTLGLHWLEVVVYVMVKFISQIKL